jgi:hypothetical protein
VKFLTCHRGGFSRPVILIQSAAKKTTSAKNQVLVEKLKELRLAHPFWGERRMTA